MVRYQIFDLIVVDVLVAEFRESIRPAIPKMITLLTWVGSWESARFEAVANALTILSEQGKVSSFLT